MWTLGVRSGGNPDRGNSLIAGNNYFKDSITLLAGAIQPANHFIKYSFS